MFLTSNQSIFSRYFLILMLLTIYRSAQADAVDDGIKAFEAKKYKEAFELLNKNSLGARGGEANFYIGNIYLIEAKEGKRDFSATYAVWEISADRGYVPAQIRLGDVFANGELGLKKNNEEAIKYYKSAISNGSKEAKAKLDLIKGGIQVTSNTKKFDGCASKLALPEVSLSNQVLINWTGDCKNGQLFGLGVATYQFPSRATPKQPDGRTKMVLANFENGFPTGVALRINPSSDRVNVSRNNNAEVFIPIWFHMDVWDKGALKRTLHLDNSALEYKPIKTEDYWYLSNKVDSLNSKNNTGYEIIQGVDLALKHAYDAANQLGLNSVNKEIVKGVLVKVSSPEKIDSYVDSELKDDTPVKGIRLSLSESSGNSELPNNPKKNLKRKTN